MLIDVTVKNIKFLRELTYLAETEPLQVPENGGKFNCLKNKNKFGENNKAPQRKCKREGQRAIDMPQV